MSDKKEVIKFVGRVSKRFPQMFPKNKASFDNGELAILNFDLLETLQGEIVLNSYGNISASGFCFPSNYDTSKHYVILAELDSIHPVYGKKWNALMCTEEIDLTNTWQQKIFLQSFLSDNQIKNLFDTFDNPIKELEEGSIQSLMKVKGIGKASAGKILLKFEANKDYSEAYIKLSSYGMTPYMIKKLVDYHGSAKILIDKVEQNPYILADEIKGIGFAKADDMALQSGMPRLSKQRLRAYIKYILNEGAMKGYSWISSSILMTKIEEELDIFPLEDVVTVVQEMKDKKIIWDGEKGKVALERYYQLEVDIKNELIRIRDGENTFSFDGWEDRIKQAEIIQGFDFTPEQIQAIEDAMKHQCMVITGKAGTGKSSTVLGAIKALGDVTFAQCCLAGKASARLEEVTGYPASTIHRLLEFSPMNVTDDNPTPFNYNKNNPLPQDVVILDEFGMIGGQLFLNLLKAVKTGSKFIMLGDRAQLSAIGALNVANDLIESDSIYVAYLNKIHRQAQKSAVITESIKISEGKQIIPKDFVGNEIKGELQDLELDIYSNSWETNDKVVKHFQEKMEKSGNDIMEVQVIVPTRNSVYKLNNRIQPLYNPEDYNKKEVYLSLDKDKGYSLRVNDKIINIKNNYKMPIAFKDCFDEWCMEYEELNGENVAITIPVFNGYTGKIIDITKKDELIIYFPLLNKNVIVLPSHWRKDKGIQLGYALTVHKCLTGDTQVYTNYGIKTLDEINNGAKFNEMKPLPKDFYVYDGESMQNNISFLNSGIQNIRKITSKMGHSISVTDEHVLDVFSDGKIIKKEGKDIKKGDILLMSIGQNIYGTNCNLPVNLLEQDKLDIRAKRYTMPQKITPSFSKFLGYMVTNGTIYEANKGIEFSTKRKEASNDFSDLLREIFNIDVKVKRKSSGDYVVKCYSKQIGKFCKKIDGLQSHDKFIPNIIMETTKENQTEFLKPIINSGVVILKKDKFNFIELLMTKGKMIKQVSGILLNMGIMHYSIRGGIENNIIRIDDEYDAKLLLKIINLDFDFSLEKGKGRLEGINLGIYGKELQLRNNINLKDFCNLVLNGTLTHNKAIDLIKVVCDEDKKILKKIFIESYPSIVSSIENEVAETYCLNVPNSHKFIQNGFRGWNCQGSSYKYPICVFDNSHYVMLNREEVYTALTRSSYYCTLVAENTALRKATSITSVQNKQTFLKDLLDKKE